jgi:hypothetical protein
MFKTTATIALAILTCGALSPDAAMAQRSARPAMRLLGEFATSMLSGLAVDWIHDRMPKPEKEEVQKAQLSRVELPEPRPERESPPPEPRRTEPRRMSASSGYTFKLAWDLPDGTYRGTLKMRDAHGLFRVRMPNGLSIDQDMEAVIFRGDVWLLASNPRYAPGTGGPDGYPYYPDNFHLVEDSGEGWTISETCDSEGEGRCSEVRVLEAMPF